MAQTSPYDTPPHGDFAAYVERLSASPPELRSASLQATVQSGAGYGSEGVAGKLKQVLAQVQEQAHQARDKAREVARDKAAASNKPAPQPAQQGKAGQQRAQQAAGQARSPKGKPAAAAPSPVADDKSAGVNPLKYFVLPLVVAIAYPFAVDVEPMIAPYETPVLVILVVRGVWLLLRDVAAAVRKRQAVAGDTAGHKGSAR